MHNTGLQQLSTKPDTCSIYAHETLWQCLQRFCRCALIHILINVLIHILINVLIHILITVLVHLLRAVPAMMPAIWPAALLGAAFWAGLLGAAASVEGAAAGLGALLANDGSCLASIHFTALHLWTQKMVTVLSVASD